MWFVGACDSSCLIPATRQVLPLVALLGQQEGLIRALSLLTLGFTRLSPPLLLPPLSQPMKPLKATATTSQPVLTIQQIETIFYKIQDIYEIHKEFYDNLCPKVQQWDSQVTMGHLFQKLVSLPWMEGPHLGPQWSCWCWERTSQPQPSGLCLMGNLGLVPQLLASPGEARVRLGPLETPCVRRCPS